MSLHQRTKEERRAIAMKSEKILKSNPRLYLKDIASRFGMSYQSLYTIRKEFGLQPTGKYSRKGRRRIE